MVNFMRKSGNLAFRLIFSPTDKLSNLDVTFPPVSLGQSSPQTLGEACLSTSTSYDLRDWNI